MSEKSYLKNGEALCILTSHRRALLSGMCCKDDTIIPVLKVGFRHLQAILPRIRRYRHHKMVVENKQANKNSDKNGTYCHLPRPVK